MKQILALVAGLVLLAAPAFAADVDGKWTGRNETPMGEVPVGFTFKADGGEAAITKGKIDGNKITFTVALDFGGMDFVIEYTGVASPDKIQLTGDVMGMVFEFTVIKAK